MARSSLSAAPTEEDVSGGGNTRAGGAFDAPVLAQPVQPVVGGFCLAFPQQIASSHMSQPTVAFPLGGMGLAPNILATPAANLGARAHLHAHPSTSGVPRAQHVAAHLHVDLGQLTGRWLG
ncbi:hypothetical protein KFE25_002125 [Diacronema lutheri]|uniref:Uncharacterized protein n=1 Tax=Diacronema lutheri TaxID=2081491 RepID=A0A8J5XTQ5_DIALT|nr:hypothetical protein KFE25_002125 [Diacronema lutheri]